MGRGLGEYFVQQGFLVQAVAIETIEHVWENAQHGQAERVVLPETPFTAAGIADGDETVLVDRKCMGRAWREHGIPLHRKWHV
jgi:hypothetical protein